MAYKDKFLKLHDDFVKKINSVDLGLGLENPIVTNNKYFSGIDKKSKKRIEDGMLNMMRKYLNKYPAGSCGNIHNMHLEEIAAVIPGCKNLYTTVGALYKDDKNLYNVPDEQEYLENSMGIYNISSTPKQFHFWVTADSGEIIDLAHNMTMFHLFKNKSDFFPIIGAPETIMKKYSFNYIPYRIEGHINI